MGGRGGNPWRSHGRVGSGDAPHAGEEAVAKLAHGYWLRVLRETWAA